MATDVISVKQVIVIGLMSIAIFALGACSYAANENAIDKTLSELMQNAENQDNITINIPDSVRKTLNDAYSNSTVENLWCMYGNYTNDTINIQHLGTVEIVTATANDVSYIACGEDTHYLGTIHTHPSGICIHSNQDIFEFGKDYERRKTKPVLAGVMCGMNKFVFHTPTKLHRAIYVD